MHHSMQNNAKKKGFSLLSKWWIMYEWMNLFVKLEERNKPFGSLESIITWYR